MSTPLSVSANLQKLFLLLLNMDATNRVSSGGSPGARAHCCLPPSIRTQAPYVTAGSGGSGGIWAGGKRLTQCWLSQATFQVKNNRQDEQSMRRARHVEVEKEVLWVATRPEAPSFHQQLISKDQQSRVRVGRFFNAKPKCNENATIDDEDGSRD